MSASVAQFWESIRDISRLTRRASKVDIDAAMAAMEVERMADEKLQGLNEAQSLPMAASFSRRKEDPFPVK